MTTVVHLKPIPLPKSYRPQAANSQAARSTHAPIKAPIKPAPPRPAAPTRKPLPATPLTVTVALLSAKVDRLQAEAVNYGILSQKDIVTAGKELQKRNGGLFADAILHLTSALATEEARYAATRLDFIVSQLADAGLKTTDPGMVDSDARQLLEGSSISYSTAVRTVVSILKGTK